ncbi:hypothetical protein L3Q82_009252 [Scortum barcoo]|uniref:Uncharacterized protein n=1 Tax=Scortum barcoo TaxID=214431 RepID=A0ACB8WH02_9TELE|nr:hypothetical protein L3Q82_009252 [Scortum barcoo]
MDNEFKKFKWFLKHEILEGFSGIPQAHLEKAERQDTVDLMVQKYQGPGALKLSLKVLEEINRNDLVQRLLNFCSEPKEEYNRKQPERKKAELVSVRRFAVEVTLDPHTAHPNLILSGDGKQVHHGDVRKKLPDNPKRFNKCLNVLGKQSFSSGKFYFEVQVKGKTAWALGVAKESIKRKGGIIASTENGYWTVMLRDGDVYKANNNDLVNHYPNQQPQKVGVFVNYEEGLVSFYDVDAGDLFYSFTDCSFTGKLHPFLTPCTNNGGRNSAPLIISPVNQTLNLKTHDLGDQKEEYERKKAELKRLQRFAVEVTLDPDTAHPALLLSEDGKQVYYGNVHTKLPANPKRFERCVYVLGRQSFSSGRFYYEVQVKGKTAWTVGVSIDRKGNITLSPDNGFWTLCLRDGNEYKAIGELSVHLSLKSHPQKVGVFVDYEEGLVSFYDVDTADLLYSFTGCSFTEKLYPFLSPSTKDGGTNTVPLIISPINDPVKRHDLGDQKEEYERKRAELKRLQWFAVEVILDPDTAHPALLLSDDGKQVHSDNVWKKLPENSDRFRRCVNVLGKQSFSSGRFYFEVQVKGKTAWTVGVAKESIDRKGYITLSPDNGFWTLWLRKGYEYKAIDEPSVLLSLKQQPEKVGVFVDYEEGLVSFYDVDTADLLYSFTDCVFTEKLHPFFSPCTNGGGTNSAPLIISPVNCSLNLKPHDLSDQKEEYERKKAKLKKFQLFAVEVTLDPETAHPALFLSEDCKQVHHGDVWQKLPNNPMRFKRCLNVLGKQSFSSGKFYFEVQVKGKTAWTLGVAKESIRRKGDITTSPENGYWTIKLMDGDVYKANDDDPVRLFLNQQPQKVGVFVDYEEGLVSFHDVDATDLLYCFSGWSFTEKLHPFFSPGTHDNRTNSTPLIICPINLND